MKSFLKGFRFVKYHANSHLFLEANVSMPQWGKYCIDVTSHMKEGSFCMQTGESTVAGLVWHSAQCMFHLFM